jgi:hypothetical protein
VVDVQLDEVAGQRDRLVLVVDLEDGVAPDELGGLGERPGLTTTDPPVARTCAPVSLGSSPPMVTSWPVAATSAR